ncbi:hypothetical protein VTK26DRAFT_14 [Humicola hyalothermophila]
MAAIARFNGLREKHPTLWHAIYHRRGRLNLQFQGQSCSLDIDFSFPLAHGAAHGPQSGIQFDTHPAYQPDMARSVHSVAWGLHKFPSQNMTHRLGFILGCRKLYSKPCHPIPFTRLT